MNYQRESSRINTSAAAGPQAGRRRRASGGFSWWFYASLRLPMAQKRFNQATFSLLEKEKCWLIINVCSALFNSVVHFTFTLQLMKNYANYRFPPGPCSKWSGPRLFGGPRHAAPRVGWGGSGGPGTWTSCAVDSHQHQQGGGVQLRW